MSRNSAWEGKKRELEGQKQAVGTPKKTRYYPYPYYFQEAPSERGKAKNNIYHQKLQPRQPPQPDYALPLSSAQRHTPSPPEAKTRCQRSCSPTSPPLLLVSTPACRIGRGGMSVPCIQTHAPWQDRDDDMMMVCDAMIRIIRKWPKVGYHDRSRWSQFFFPLVFSP